MHTRILSGISRHLCNISGWVVRESWVFIQSQHIKGGRWDLRYAVVSECSCKWIFFAWWYSAALQQRLNYKAGWIFDIVAQDGHASRWCRVRYIQLAVHSLPDRYPFMICSIHPYDCYWFVLWMQCLFMTIALNNTLRMAHHADIAYDCYWSCCMWYRHTSQHTGCGL